MPNTSEEKVRALKELIEKEVIVTDKQQKIASSSSGQESKWLFDFRNIFLKPDALSLIVDIFWDIFEKEYPFQVGGQEVAAIPLVSAIVLKSHLLGKPVNGFFIRKTRKNTGLQKIIEGQLNENKIILVDDLINSRKTIFRQMKVLSDVGKKVDFVFTLLNFRMEDNIKNLKKEGVSLHSLFSLDDFGLTMNNDQKKLPKESFQAIWRFQGSDPNYFYRVPKSAPCLDGNKLYFGSDTSYFYALWQENGAVAWKFKVGNHPKGKTIFSSPVIYQNKVYFGSYDGNLYALDKETGKLKWKYMDADFIGSSPAIADDLGLLFIGFEYGLINKKGGIEALDLKTGKKVWDFKMSNFVHSSPAYCMEKKLVAIGDNDSFVYMFDAKNGELKWKHRTGGPVKASFVFDLKHNLVLFGSFDKCLYALDIDSGKIKGKYETEEVIYSTPVIYKNSVCFSSLDKNVYNLNLDTGKLNWSFATSGRVFSSPEVIEDRIFFGSNDGRMYELDPENGQAISFFQTTERITNKIAYNPASKRFFVPTYANEIYCLERK